MLIDLIYAVILGVIEGITEWLPISSTAHIIIIEKMFYSSNYKPSFCEEFLLLFDVLIQLGAIIAVIIIYFKKLYPFKYNNDELKSKDKLTIWFKVLFSCLPIIIVALLFDDVITKYLYNLTTISIVLILYGVIFIFIENSSKKYKITDIKEMSYKKSIVIGFIQVLALIPGTSRSGVTIIGGNILDCDRKTSMEYSFFLSIPIMLGASIYKLGKYLIYYKITLNEIIILLIAMLVAMLTSLIVIKKLLEYIKNNSFKVFGIYRIALGIIILIISLF